MNPDNVCAEYADKRGMEKVAIQIFQDEDGGDWVLIEGEAPAIEFLGNILIAQAKFEKDCSFFFGPESAGNIFFTKNSTHGICIHRLPCLENKGRKLQKP